MAAASSLLILFVAFTVAVAHPPSPSDQAIVVKKCSQALGPRGSELVTFCARDLLGHRAAFLASCDRRKTVAVVIKEAHKKAMAVEALGKKINSGDKSLSAKEVQDLKRCWGFANTVFSSAGKLLRNAAVKEPSSPSDTEAKVLYAQAAGIKEHCNFSAAERQSGLWLELQVKVVESMAAEGVAVAFVNHLYSITL